MTSFIQEYTLFCGQWVCQVPEDDKSEEEKESSAEIWLWWKLDEVDSVLPRPLLLCKNAKETLQWLYSSETRKPLLPLLLCDNAEQKLTILQWLYSETTTNIRNK